MNISSKIDYITSTLKVDDFSLSPDRVSRLEQLSNSAGLTDVPPPKFYEFSVEMVNGSVCSVGKNGALIRYGGGALRDESAAMLALMTINDNFDRVTRYDIAIDIIDAKEKVPYTPQAALKAYIEKFPNGKWINFNDETVYLGSSSSDNYVRVYNKAVELGLGDSVSWIRHEIVIKGKAARALTKPFVASELIDKGLSIMMNRNPLIAHLLNPESPTLPYSGRLYGETETAIAWYENQVIPNFTRLSIRRLDLAAYVLERMKAVFAAAAAADESADDEC